MRLGGYHVVCVAIYFPVQRLIGCVPYVGTLARQLWQIDKRQSFGTTGHTLSRPNKNEAGSDRRYVVHPRAALCNLNDNTGPGRVRGNVARV